MKKYFVSLLLLTLITLPAIGQNKNKPVAEIKNNEVVIKIYKLVESTNSGAKNGNKYLIADVEIENISGKSIQMGAEYTMGMTIKDASGNEYRSGLKGEGIVSSYLAKNGNEKQDQKAHNLCFSDNFPPKTKARSSLCGFEVPKDAKIVSFGVKKKNMWGELKN